MRKLLIMILAFALIGCSKKENTTGGEVSTTLSATTTDLISEESGFRVYSNKNSEVVELSESDKEIIGGIMERLVSIKEDEFFLREGAYMMYTITFGDEYEVYPFKGAILFRNMNDGAYYVTSSVKDGEEWMKILTDHNGDDYLNIMNQSMIVNDHYTYPEDVLSEVSDSSLFDAFETKEYGDGQYLSNYIGSFRFMVKDGQLYINDEVTNHTFTLLGVNDVSYVSPFITCGGGEYATIVSKDHKAYSLNLYLNSESNGVLANYEVIAALNELTYDFDWEELKVVDNSTPYTTCGLPTAYARLNEDHEWHIINDDGSVGDTETNIHPYFEYITLSDTNLMVGDALFLFNDGTIHVGTYNLDEMSQTSGEALADENGEMISDLVGYVVFATTNNESDNDMSVLFFTKGWNAYKYDYKAGNSAPTHVTRIKDTNSKGYTYEASDDGYVINVKFADGSSVEYKGYNVYTNSFDQQ